MEMSTTLTEEDAFRLQRQMAEREKEISRLVQHYKELDAKARSVKKQIKEEQRHRKAYGGVDAGKVQERLISKQIYFEKDKLNRMKIMMGKLETAMGNIQHEINEDRKIHNLHKVIHSQLKAELEEAQQGLAKQLQYSERLAHEGEKIKGDSRVAHEEQQSMLERFNGSISEIDEALTNMRIQDTKRKCNGTHKHRSPPGSATASMTIPRSPIAPPPVKRPFTVKESEEEDGQYHFQFPPDQLEQAFAILKQHSQLNTVPEILNLFFENEEQNFKLYQYIQRTNKEIRAVEDSIARLHDSAGRDAHVMEKSNLVTMRRIDEVTDTLASVKSKAEAYISLHKDYETTMSKLTKELEKLFFDIDVEEMIQTIRKQGISGFSEEKLRKNQRAGMELLRFTVNEHNILDFFAVVEERVGLIAELFKTFNRRVGSPVLPHIRVERKRRDPPMAPVPKLTSPLPFMPGKHSTLVEEDIDEDIMPLSPRRLLAQVHGGDASPISPVLDRSRQLHERRGSLKLLKSAIVATNSEHRRRSQELMSITM